MKKLGVAGSGDAAAAAVKAPDAVDNDAAVSADVSVTLTYVQQGDQRSVSGVESGNANALITTFDPSQGSYGPGGALSSTKESMSFAGMISGGSLFSTTSGAWLAGAIGESTKAVTTIPGPNEITISRQSTSSAEFVTSPSVSPLASQESSALQISFAQDVNTAAAGTAQEQITLSTSQSSTESQVSLLGHSASYSSHHSAAGASVTWTPIQPVSNA